MDHSIIEKQGTVVIRLEGNILGGPDGTELHERLRGLKEAGQKNIVVDLSGAKFMSSGGLGMLISAMTTLRNGGGDLRLAEVPPKVQQLMRLTKLDTVFKSYDDVDEAVVSYTAEPV